MHRFFVPPPTFTHQPITLTGDQAHQVRRVLRMRLGDRAILLDGQGRACEAILIAISDADVRFQAVRHWDADGEPATRVILYQAMLKGDHFAWALQKGTEVGVSAFVPIICERNVVDDMAAVESKRARWERIIQEAAEQSGRGRLPELRPAQLFGQAATPIPSLPLSFDRLGTSSARERGNSASIGSNDFSRSTRHGATEVATTEAMPPSPVGKGAGGEGRLLLWEGEHELRLRDALAGCNFASGVSIQIFVGPEGGFTEEEVALARRYGIQPVTLGPRILRAETAGAIATALILYEAGDI
jgi:16S rRNA (uracil1498-N3)-methyltransferase